VRCIPKPVHEGERCAVKGAFRNLIIDDDELAGDAGGFGHQFWCIMTMMKNVNESYDVDALIVALNRTTIEQMDGSAGLIAEKDIKPFDLYVESLTLQETGDAAIAGSDVENSRRFGDKFADSSGRNLSSAPINQVVMGNSRDKFQHGGSSAGPTARRRFCCEPHMARLSCSSTNIQNY
jgi:hypothetical protein